MAIIRRSSSRRRRRFPRMLILGLVAVLAITFAPQVLMRTSLRDHLVDFATQGLEGDVSVAQMTGGWFSPLVVREVVALDASGATLLEVEEIQTESSLLGLVLGGFSNPTITVDQPRLFVSFEQDSSNVERAISKWLAPSESASSVSCTIRIHQGSALVKDTVTGREWSAEQIQAEYRASLPTSSELDLALTLVPELSERGDLQVTYSMTGASHQLKVSTAQIPLPIADPLIRRWDSQVAMTGAATGEAEVEWAKNEVAIRIESLTVNELSLWTARWLRDERLQIPLIVAAGSLELTESEWHARDLRVNSEMFNLQLSGDGQLTEDLETAASQLLRGIPDSRVRLAGEIDVARIAQAIPETLRLREGRQITAGNLSFAVESGDDGGWNRWTGELTADRLAAVDGSRVVDWESPLQASFSARHRDEAWQFDDLTCRGSFVALSARGSLDQGTLSFDGDLSRFTADAGQFFQLNNIELAGQLTGSASWKQGQNGELHFTADAQTRDLLWAMPSGMPWREPALRLALSGDAITQGNRIDQITTGTVSLISGSDEFQGSLTSPVELTSGADAAWPLRVGLRGHLSTWLPRLQYLVSGIAPSWDGSIDLDTRLVLAGPSIEVESAAIQFQDLSGQIAGLDIRERQLQVDLAGSWDTETARGSASELSCVGSTVSFRAEDIAVAVQPTFHLSGRVGYRADLERVSSWLGTSGQRLRGELTGHAVFTDDGQSTTVQGDAEARNFAYETAASQSSGTQLATTTRSSKWDTLWAEKQLKLATQATFNRRAGNATLDLVELSSAAISLGATGTVQDVGGRCELDLAGQVSYDLQQLTETLGPASRVDIKLTGVSTQPFAFHGPLRPVSNVSYTSGTPTVGRDRGHWAQFTASSKFDWETALIYGLPIGGGVVDARLADGLMTFEPIDLEVSGGRVTVTPSLDMRQDPILLKIPRGMIAERVAISREMCHTWLKYVAPLVADATIVEGSLSISVEESTVPLHSIASGRLKGVLDVHAARVGPGELTTQFLSVAETLRSLLRKQQPSGISADWIDLPEQRIAFHAENNRVHHEGLQFLVDNVRVSTSGSVGIDQSMTLVATVAIPDDWVANDRWLSALRGQTLQIPIGGSLSAPRLDARAVDQLTKQVLGGAANRLIEQELGRGLERLFGR